MKAEQLAHVLQLMDEHLGRQRHRRQGCQSLHQHLAERRDPAAGSSEGLGQLGLVAIGPRQLASRIGEVASTNRGASQDLPVKAAVPSSVASRKMPTNQAWSLAVSR